jgi:hypothetical protein
VLFEFFDVLAHGAVLPPETERRRRPPAFPGKDGGERKSFSETQGPEGLQNRSQPRRKPSKVIVLTTAHQPVSQAGNRLAQKGRGRLGAL